MYLVGGAVRDLLLAGGTDARSFDDAERDFVVCGLPLDMLMRELARFGKCDFVGKSFGVIKFRPDRDCEFMGWKLPKGATYDIALPRVERSTGIHHRDFDIKYDPAIRIEDDLMRRDFTINAMAMKTDGAIVDPSNGRDDLSMRLIRLVFANSLQEDPLRILRAARMAAKLKFDLDPALVKSAGDVSVAEISPERVREELDKALTATPNPSLFFRNLHHMQTLLKFFPEMLAILKYLEPLYDALERTGGVQRRWAFYWFLDREPDIVAWFAEYFGDSSDTRPFGAAGLALRLIEWDKETPPSAPSETDAFRLFDRLRYSNKDIAQAMAVSQLSMNVSESLYDKSHGVTPRALIRSTLKAAAKTWVKPSVFLRFACDFFGAQFAAVDDDWRDGLADVESYLALPPITGRRLIRMGFPEGASIGMILDEVSRAHDIGIVTNPVEAEMFVLERYGGMRSGW